MLTIRTNVQYEICENLCNREDGNVDTKRFVLSPIYIRYVLISLIEWNKILTLKTHDFL